MPRPEDFSKLPSDPAYWAALEARVLAEITGGAPAPDWSEPDWCAPLVRRSWSLSALAAAAAIAVSFVPRASTPQADAATLPIQSLAAPASTSGQSLNVLLSGAAAPPLARILVAPVRRSPR